MKLAENAIVHVDRAEHVGDYKLQLVFSDGSSQVVDFYPFLSASSNPLIRAYLELKRFKQFTVCDGDLMWGDYDLVFPIADLYEGSI